MDSSPGTAARFTAGILLFPAMIPVFPSQSLLIVGPPSCFSVFPRAVNISHKVTILKFQFLVSCDTSDQTAVHPVLCFDPDPVDRKGISVVIQRKLWIHRHKTASFRTFLLFHNIKKCIEIKNE